MKTAMLLIMMTLTNTSALAATIAPNLTLQDFFHQLNANNVDQLVDQFYSSETFEFTDPVVHFTALAEMKKYYQHQYKNLKSIHFDFHDVVTEGKVTTGTWTMTLEHPRINGGKPFSVDGVSVVKYDSSGKKVAYHRDYFDMGAFVYEHVPVMGAAIRFIKKKLQPTE